MIVVPFLPSHLEGFELQKEQSLMHKYLMDESYIDTIGLTGEAWTGLVDGNVKVIAGVFKAHEHIGVVWALIGKDGNKYMPSITKNVLKWLDKNNTPRLETAVRRDFNEGHRWAKIMGFENETPEKGMKNYGSDGETYDLYARFN